MYEDEQENTHSLTSTKTIPFLSRSEYIGLIKYSVYLVKKDRHCDDPIVVLKHPIV
jgi:hypothetical protein